MTSAASERVKSLIDFLEAFDARKNPPIHDVAQYRMELLRDVDVPALSPIRLVPAGEQWLTVDFVELPPRPVVPEGVSEIVGPATALSPHLAPTIDLSDDATDEDFLAAEVAEQWVTTVWRDWAQSYRDMSTVKQFYRRLFELRDLHSHDRDALELVWGFGRVRWTPAGGQVVDHPLLTIPVEIDIDDETPRIAVRPAGALTVETTFLSDIDVDDRSALNAVRQSLADVDSPVDPWDIDARRDLLKRLVRCIDHEGVLDGEGDAVGGPAVVDTSWLLYIRRRRPDYQGFLDTMRELYENGTMPPDPLKAIVIDAPSTLLGGEEHGSTRSLDPLLLPLETNEQQLRIVNDIQYRTGIIVQGPPGTGKSHTIANIISHYVAYGRRVLVVAEKEQALRVLADKIPPGIRDLTVSVLGADDEGRRRLESAITKIQTRVSSLDRSDSTEAIDRLEAVLERIDGEVAAATEKLLSSRAAETATLSGPFEAGTEITPSTAAEWVAEHVDDLGYLDDPVALETSAPLTNSELGDLQALLQRIGVERASSSACAFPNVNTLPTGAALATSFAELDALSIALASARPEVSDWSQIDTATPELIASLASACEDEHNWAMKIAGTWLTRVSDQHSDPQLGPEWPEFALAMRTGREQIRTVSLGLESHDVTVPAQTDPSFDAALRAALARLTEKGRLGWFSSDSKKSLELCRVDGRLPTTASDVELCLQAVRRQDLRRRFVTRWTNRMILVDGPALDDALPEVAIRPLLDDLDRTLETQLRWSVLRAGLLAHGILAPLTPTSVNLDRLCAVLTIVKQRAYERDRAHDLAEITNALTNGSQQSNSSPLWRLLLNDLSNKRTESWDRHREEAAELAELAPDALRLRELLGRLRIGAPQWCSKLVAGPTLACDPASFQRAWQWRQLDTWVCSVARSNDPATLQHDLEELSTRRRRVVADLVSERAWRRLADNLSDRHVQALNRYLGAVKRFGKTGGKFAARWLAEIRQALNDSKDAVPVWIMTTSRALSSFRPDVTPPFDLLIIDEASQIGLEAIPLFSLAKSTIVVGDDKQTSPENVGSDQQTFFSLLDQYLAGIPAYKTLFALNNSLYDIAGQKFPTKVMLTEHFRSLPEIIAFSNEHIYDHAIIPLRDQAPVPGWKPLGAIKVVNGYRRGDENGPEAEAVVDLIERFCADPQYDGSDFGVVTLQGTAQAKLIWSKLYERLGSEIIRERNIRCGEPSNFQGDERDIIVISLVVATDPNNPTGRIGAMTGLPAERRINVAATRARDQMWVAHSIDPDRFPNGDLRAELIRHCQNPGAPAAVLEQLEERCESEFERRVLRRIIAHGYRKVTVQHEVNRYRIDIVVEGPDARLAVECDGDRWHGPEVWHRDRARQQVLERAKWTFERIRGSAFFRDPDAALAPLWDRLDELGIPTGDEWMTTGERSTVLTVNTNDHEGATEQPFVEVALEKGDDSVAKVTPVLRSELTPSRMEPSLAQWPAPVSLPQATPNEPAHAFEPGPDVAAPGRTTPARTDAPMVGSRESVPPLFSSLEPATFQEALPRLRGLTVFTPWIERPLPEQDFATQDQLIEGLVDIVAAEGPMHSLRAYQLYTKAAGGQRVGKEIRRTFNRAANRAVQTGRLSQIKDSLPGQVDKTLYIPGTPPVVVRELGPRQLSEVPRSEISDLMRQLGISGEAAGAQRIVLDTLGLTRLTERVSAYLDECLRYRWTA